MKKTTIRSALAVLLAASTLTACGGSAASSAPASAAASGAAEESTSSEAASSTAAAPAKQYTIGIAEAQANDETTVRRAYLENYIGPAYNVKFIFSEQGVKMFHNIYLSFLVPRAKPGHGPPQGLLCHIYCTVFSSRFQRFLHKLRSYFAFLFTVAQKGRYRAAKNIAHP